VKHSATEEGMYQQQDIDSYLDLVVGRLPGESLAAAGERILQSESNDLGTLAPCLVASRMGDGISSCGIFLLAGTSLRHVCAKCRSIVRAGVIPCGVEFENGDKCGSLEQAKRSAIWRLKCECHRQR